MRNWANPVLGPSRKAKKLPCAQAEPKLEGLPSEVVSKIVLTLCHDPRFNPMDGGVVDDRLYKCDVYPLFLASPRIYRSAKEDPGCARVIKEAESEDNFRRYYEHLEDEGGEAYLW